MRYAKSKYNTFKYTHPEFVFDRTDQDVINRTRKGVFGKIDINRIEYRTEELQQILRELGFEISFITKVNWDYIDICFLEDINRIRNNVNSLQLTLKDYIPQTVISYSVAPTVHDINQLEKILDTVQTCAESIAQQRIRYSGYVVAGREVLQWL